jgi:hypothetical protein
MASKAIFPQQSFLESFLFAISALPHMLPFAFFRSSSGVMAEALQDTVDINVLLLLLHLPLHSLCALKHDVCALGHQELPQQHEQHEKRPCQG